MPQVCDPNGNTIVLDSKKTMEELLEESAIKWKPLQVGLVCEETLRVIKDLKEQLFRAELKADAYDREHWQP